MIIFSCAPGAAGIVYRLVRSCVLARRARDDRCERRPRRSSFDVRSLDDAEFELGRPVRERG